MSFEIFFYELLGHNSYSFFTIYSLHKLEHKWYPSDERNCFCEKIVCSSTTSEYKSSEEVNNGATPAPGKQLHNTQIENKKFKEQLTYLRINWLLNNSATEPRLKESFGIKVVSFIPMTENDEHEVARTRAKTCPKNETRKLRKVCEAPLSRTANKLLLCGMRAPNNSLMSSQMKLGSFFPIGLQT